MEIYANWNWSPKLITSPPIHGRIIANSRVHLSLPSELLVNAVSIFVFEKENLVIIVSNLIINDLGKFESF